LLAFLPTGGVIDRLGDGREKARDAAREALVSMGTTAFKSGGTNPTPAGSFKGKDPSKGAETPLAIFERFVRELGFASKVWRVREQVRQRSFSCHHHILTSFSTQIILTLVSIRQSNPFFPIKPYLTPLVETLEDGDGTVRECSRQSVITLFSGPTVTDAARADLKNEMNKRGVRKSIVDGVLLKLLSSSSTTGAEESAAEDRPPPTSRKTMPSTAPKPGVTSRSVTQPSVRDAPPERPPSSMAGEASSSAGASITDVSAVYVSFSLSFGVDFSLIYLFTFVDRLRQRSRARILSNVAPFRGMCNLVS
jgi:CLIP-associating protein 1/2